jgi:hypothetical protein
MLAQFSEGGIGVLLDETAESLQGGLIECGAPVPAAGPWFEGVRPAAELEQSGDGRDIDAEAMRDLASRSLVAVDGGDDPFSEIVG